MKLFDKILVVIVAVLMVLSCLFGSTAGICRK